MNTFYIYIFLLIISIIFIISGIWYSIKYAPLRMRIFISLVFILLNARYIVLCILLFHKNIIFLYLLKPLFFINYLCIPMIFLITIYIFMRNDKVKFYVLFYIFAFMALLYIGMMFKLLLISSNIEIMANLGYVVNIANSKLINAIYFAVNFGILIMVVMMLDNPRVNKTGMTLTVISLFVLLIEILTRFIGVKILPQNLIGDLLCILSLNYGIYKFKKNTM